MEKQTGMVQYFYHSPSSKLPIRDVLNEWGKGYKPEPHIEAGAENLLSSCYQRNIKKMAQSDRNYLFLITKCANPRMKNFYDNQYIIGYILKKETGERKGRIFIRGETFLFDFQDSLLTKAIFGWNFNQPKLCSMPYVDEEKTSRILGSFSGKENILEKCIHEIDMLDSGGFTCYPHICGFRDSCLRIAPRLRVKSAFKKSCRKS